jgi:hypothetical protein
MPIGNPSYIYQMAMAGATKNPAFASLSPASQAAIQRAASYPPGSALRQSSSDPTLKAAIQEAQAKGILDNSPLWESVLKGTALTLGAAIAAPAIAGALSGGAAAGGAAAGGGTTLGEAGPLAADEVFAAGPVEAGTGIVQSGLEAAAPIAGAATGFGAALKAALPTIIGAGASLGGAAIASSGNTEAAKIAAAQQQAALDQAKLIYQQQRADLSPYRQEGAAALGAINFGVGLPSITPTQGPFDTSTGPQGTTVGAPTATGPIVAAGAKDAQGNPLPGAGQNQVIPNPPTSAQTMGTLSTVGGGGTVRIQDPTTGLVHLVPQGQAAAAQQAGGRLV